MMFLEDLVNRNDTTIARNKVCYCTPHTATA
jgi:hypothetical protein